MALLTAFGNAVLVVFVIGLLLIAFVWSLSRVDSDRVCAVVVLAWVLGLLTLRYYL